MGIKYLFFEPHTVKQVQQSVIILNNMKYKIQILDSIRSLFSEKDYKKFLEWWDNRELEKILEIYTAALLKLEQAIQADVEEGIKNNMLEEFRLLTIAKTTLLDYLQLNGYEEVTTED